MKNIEFCLLVEELNKTFEERVQEARESASQLIIDNYRGNAETVVLQYMHGSYICDNGKRVNVNGEYINEKMELVNYNKEKINADGSRINENGDVIEGKLNYHQTLREIKNRPLCFFENKIENLICEMANLNHNGSLSGLDIDNYLRLAFICHRWGLYISCLGSKCEAEARKYLYDALMYISMWMGGSNVLMINKEIDAGMQERASVARLGGKGRAKNYASLKSKVIELLGVNAPAGGWKSKVSAIDSLESSIVEFIREERINFDLVRKESCVDYSASWDKIRRMISDWSRNDNQIKSVFDEVVIKNIINKKV